MSVEPGPNSYFQKEPYDPLNTQQPEDTSFIPTRRHRAPIVIRYSLQRSPSPEPGLSLQIEQSNQPDFQASCHPLGCTYPPHFSPYISTEMDDVSAIHILDTREFLMPIDYNPDIEGNIIAHGRAEPRSDSDQFDF
jgi:hypothetical protein